MPTEISTISFQEDYLIWSDVEKNNEEIKIKRAVIDSLPISIDHQALQQSISAKQIANHINGLAQKYEFNANNVRITIPGKFTAIKKILVDDSVARDDYRELVNFEFEKSWDEPRDHYHIYLPEYERKNGDYREIMGVAIRKTVLEFFKDLMANAHMGIADFSPSCFNLDNFFRTIYPEIRGTTLLIGWQRRGYDFIVLNENHFVSYFHRPYNSSHSEIDQTDENDILSGFDALIEEVQHPSLLSGPSYKFDQIYCFGFHFKPQWMDMLKAQIQAPIELFTPDHSTKYKFVMEDPDLSSFQLFQVIESISNIF